METGRHVRSYWYEINQERKEREVNQAFMVRMNARYVVASFYSPDKICASFIIVVIVIIVYFDKNEIWEKETGHVVKIYPRHQWQDILILVNHHYCVVYLMALFLLLR